MVKFCKYCGCLILESGRCRNNKCVLGERKKVTEMQILKIQALKHELNEDPLTDDEIQKLNITSASKLISKLIARKGVYSFIESEVIRR